MFGDLQNKPEKVRQKWALGISLFITLIVLTVWLSTLSIQVENTTIFSTNTSEHARYGSFAHLYFNVKKGVVETVSLVADLF